MFYSSNQRNPYGYYPPAWPGLYPYRTYDSRTYFISYVQPAASYVRKEAAGVQSCISPAELELNRQFRTLWEQHVAWTRMLIISIAASLPDEAAVTERLLRNAPDMAAVFARYYGEQVASQFGELVKEHLVIAAELVKAAKAGDKQATAEAEKKWYANADEWAAFMSSINPNWPQADLRNMLHDHLRLTKDEAVLRISGKFKQDIAAFDSIEKQALEMADAFTAGIVKQFPDRFGM